MRGGIEDDRYILVDRYLYWEAKDNLQEGRRRRVTIQTEGRNVKSERGRFGVFAAKEAEKWERESELVVRSKGIL